MLRDNRIVDQLRRDWERAGSTLVFTVANFGHAELALNLALSCRAWGISIAVFALDDQTTRYLSGLVPVYPVPASMLLAASHAIGIGEADFGTADFRPLTWARYGIVNGLLKEGFSPVYLDTDVVVRGDLLKAFREIWAQYSDANTLVQQNIRGAACMGVFSVCSAARDAWQKIFHESELERHDYASIGGSMDQRYFNKVVLPSKEYDLRVRFLPQDKFPTGSFMRDNMDLVREQAALIHYNGVVGIAEKILEMRTNGDWFLGDRSMVF